MPASARLAHVADPCAIWYQFNQYTPLAGRVPTVGVLTGFAVSVERHGEVIFDEELTCFILAGRRDACGDGVIRYRRWHCRDPAGSLIWLEAFHA